MELLELEPATLLALTLKMYVVLGVRLLISKCLDAASFTSINCDVQNRQIL